MVLVGGGILGLTDENYSYCVDDCADGYTLDDLRVQ